MSRAPAFVSTGAANFSAKSAMGLQYACTIAARASAQFAWVRLSASTVEGVHAARSAAVLAYVSTVAAGASARNAEAPRCARTFGFDPTAVNA